ncbi:hypothetical protein [Pseudoruegeria sp. SHC-113]|uniref:hypothetical protein n=1 Tax=Pseudoruegeria sp. SHC-113 TaxID=2855439 RepID=UPI0021BB1ADA|nr:hypothetical protein [Pseudoruegeria sp. SHC-113]MCT8160031.1 hypothetical protein [Pseudoruegeria sp. SHC-113]
MRRLAWIGALSCLALAVVVLAVPQVRFLFFGLPEQRLEGSAISQGEIGPAPVAEATRVQVEQALRDAGLSEEPLLGDIFISGHLARLDDGEVTSEQLMEYAEGLRVLALLTGDLGRQIPSTFWDVDTDQLRADGWDAYRVVDALAAAEGEPYLEALGGAYTRFHAFKLAETSGVGTDDTALDTALDLFDPAIKLIDAVPPEHMLETSEYIRGREQAALYLWQQLIVGSSRRNPLTHIKLFNHGFTTRFHVGTIWQYETGIALDNSTIWGVSGFAPEFVGPPENNNQVEHMSISMTVQGILREPLLILEAFEEFETLSGSATAAEAAADDALNAAIQQTFITGFEDDLPSAVAALRGQLRER